MGISSISMKPLNRVSPQRPITPGVTPGKKLNGNTPNLTANPQDPVILSKTMPETRPAAPATTTSSQKTQSKTQAPTMTQMERQLDASRIEDDGQASDAAKATRMMILKQQSVAMKSSVQSSSSQVTKLLFDS